MIRLPTASEMDRAVRCRASLTLPRVESTGVDAILGAAKHEWATAGKLPDDPELREACEAMDLSALAIRREDFSTEVAFAYDLVNDTAEEVGRHIGRNYPRRTGTVLFGTADFVGLTPDAVIIPDLKTGRGWLPTPLEAMQLRFLALAACRAYGRSIARVGFLHPWDSTWRWVELDALEQDMTALTLRNLVADLEVNESSTPSAGPWCKYCPAFIYCPAQTALIREVSWNPTQAADEMLAQLTPERAAQAYQRLHQVREALKRVDAALYAFAQENPIQLPDGKVFGPVETRREIVNGDAAYRVLAEKYGDELAMEACEMSASKASIERALRKVVAKNGGTLAELKRGVLAELAMTGGLEERISVSVKEHTPKEK